MEIKEHTPKQQIGQKKITREIMKYFEIIENENTTYQNLCVTLKAVLKGKFIAVNAYIKKRKISN